MDRQKKILIRSGIIFLSVVLTVLFLLPHHAYAYEHVYEVLKAGNPTALKIEQIWKYLLNTVNSLIILLMIAVAFVEILHINIETYKIKKVLPTLILAVVAANFSFLFCRLLVDFANVAMTFFEGCVKLPGAAECKELTAPTPSFPNSWPGFAQGLADTFWINLLVFAEAILFLILSFLMIIRNWMVYFLVSVSAVAMISMVLPQTKVLFTQWWQNLLRWTFMPVVSLMFVWLAKQFSTLIAGATTVVDTSLGITAPAGHGGASIMGTVFTCACLYAAIYIPFKLGSNVFGINVMGAWGNILKKPAAWAGKKAKEKWVDPRLGELRDRWLTYYRHNGGYTKGFRGFLGRFARRAEKTDAIREGWKQKAENAKEDLFRSAFGHKFGKDGKSATGDMTMSIEEQLKWGEFFDKVTEDTGEKEWKMKDLKAKYYDTDKGKEAAARTLQYKLRVEDTDNLIKNTENIISGYAFKNVDDPGNIFHKNGHFHNIWERVMKSRALLQGSTMMAKKFEEDALKEIEGNAYLLNATVESYREWGKTVKKLREDLAKATTEDDRNNISRSLAYAKDQMGKAKGSYDEMMVKFKKDYVTEAADGTKKMNKGLSALLQNMLTDDNGLLIEDIDNVKGLTAVAGITDSEQTSMFNDRLIKRLSILIKEEVASVQGKRSAEDSLNELRYNKYSNRALQGLLSGDLGGLTEVELRKGFAEVYNAIQGAGDINSSAFINTYRFLGEQQANLARQGLEEGQFARQQLADRLGAGMSRLSGNQQIHDSEEKAVMEDFAKNQAAISGAEWTSLSKDEQAAITAEFKMSDDYRKQMQDRLKSRLLHFTKLENTKYEEDFKKQIEVVFNEITGQFEAVMNTDIAEEDIGKHADLLQAINESIVTMTPRNQTGDAMRGFTAAAKTQFAPVRAEAGKAEEAWLGLGLGKNLTQNSADPAGLARAQEIQNRRMGGHVEPPGNRI